MLRDIFHPLVEETFRRPLLTSVVPVIDSEVDDADEPSLMGAEGHIVLFLARTGTGALDQVREAARNPRGARELSERLLLEGSRRRQVSLEEGVTQVAAQPSFAELRYGGQMLAQHLFVPDGVDVVPLVFPYEGGRLADDGFELAQRYTSDEPGSQLEALVVRKEPVLTRAEVAALEARAEGTTPIRPARWCDTTWLTVATAAVMMCTCVTTILGVGPDAVDDLHLFEDGLRDLGDEPTVEELLGLRARLLADGH